MYGSVQHGAAAAHPAPYGQQHGGRPRGDSSASSASSASGEDLLAEPVRLMTTAMSDAEKQVSSDMAASGPIARKPQDAAKDRRDRLCCYCIPLRFGIFLAAFFTFGYSVVSCIGLFTDGVNVLVGGYAERTQLIVSWTGLIGVFGGIWGMVGCYDNNKSSLRWFWYYCLCRTLVGTLVFCMDMVTLYRCERYGYSLNSYMYHNYTMQRINSEGDCSYFRTLYICGWIIDLLIGSYVLFVTHVYCQILDEREPEEFSLHFKKKQKELPRWFVSETSADGRPARPEGPVPPARFRSGASEQPSRQASAMRAGRDTQSAPPGSW